MKNDNFEEIRELITPNDDGISAALVAEILKEKGYEIELPNKESNDIRFGDLKYKGKKLEDISFERSIVGFVLGENCVFLRLTFI